MSKAELMTTPTPVEAELVEETALARRVEDNFLRRFEQNMEKAAELFERRTQLLETAHLIAIRRTRPEDWVLSRDKQGNETAMLTASGADLVADVYGIRIRNIRPLDARGVFDPERVPVDGRPGVYTLRAWCDAESGITGRYVESLEASRRSDEDFTGRSVDASGGLVFRGQGALDSDLRAAVQTLLRTKAVRVLCGMTRVPLSDLSRAWKDTGKSASACRKGSGYGSSQERTAGGVAEEGIAAKAEAFWKEILRRTGGDTEAAAQVLRECTAYPAGKNKSTGKEYRAFSGVDSWQKITTERSLESAKRKLSEHGLFGDDSAQFEGREPGE